MLTENIAAPVPSAESVANDYRDVLECAIMKCLIHTEPVLIVVDRYGNHTSNEIVICSETTLRPNMFILAIVTRLGGHIAVDGMDIEHILAAFNLEVSANLLLSMDERIKSYIASRSGKWLDVHYADHGSMFKGPCVAAIRLPLHPAERAPV